VIRTRGSKNYKLVKEQHKLIPSIISKKTNPKFDCEILSMGYFRFRKSSYIQLQIMKDFPVVLDKCAQEKYAVRMMLWKKA
jgi:hypothetical protein